MAVEAAGNRPDARVQTRRRAGSTEETVQHERPRQAEPGAVEAAQQARRETDGALGIIKRTRVGR